MNFMLYGPLSDLEEQIQGEKSEWLIEPLYNTMVSIFYRYSTL